MEAHLADGQVEFPVVLDHEIGILEWISELGEGFEHGSAGHVVRLVACPTLEMRDRHFWIDSNLDQADPTEEVLASSEERLAQRESHFLRTSTGLR